MAYTVELLPTAEEQLSKLPKDAQRRIARKIDSLAENPRPPDAKLLKNTEKFYRIRVGDYRLIYSIDGRHLVVLVIRIGHRRDVYRNLAALSHQVLIWKQKRQ